MTAVKETTSIKLDKKAKEEAKKIFKQLGITMGDAFNMFLYQVTLQKGLPFEVKIPNDETKKAIEAIERGEDLAPFSFEELGINDANHKI